MNAGDQFWCVVCKWEYLDIPESAIKKNFNCYGRSILKVLKEVVLITRNGYIWEYAVNKGDKND